MKRNTSLDAAAIQELFSAFGPVRCRRVFGGIGVYADDVMFALEAHGQLYLKADHATKEAFTRDGCEPFSFTQKGRRVSTSYWRLPNRLLDDPDELAGWARAALAVARKKAARSRGSGTPERHSK